MEEPFYFLESVDRIIGDLFEHHPVRRRFFVRVLHLETVQRLPDSFLPQRLERVFVSAEAVLSQAEYHNAILASQLDDSFQVQRRRVPDRACRKDVVELTLVPLEFEYESFRHEERSFVEPAKQSAVGHW